MSYIVIIFVVALGKNWLFFVLFVCCLVWNQGGVVLFY